MTARASARRRFSTVRLSVSAALRVGTMTAHERASAVPLLRAMNACMDCKSATRTRRVMRGVITGLVEVPRACRARRARG